MTKARAWETAETGEPDPTGAEADDADKVGGTKCCMGKAVGAARRVARGVQNRNDAFVESIGAGTTEVHR